MNKMHIESKLFNDALKQKHTLDYFINNSFKQNNLIIFDNKTAPDKMSFFRELLYFYNGSSVLGFKDIEKYTLCFWRNNEEYFCGIFDLKLQESLNYIHILDDKIKQLIFIHTS